MHVLCVYVYLYVCAMLYVYAYVWVCIHMCVYMCATVCTFEKFIGISWKVQIQIFMLLKEQFTISLVFMCEHVTMKV